MSSTETRRLRVVASSAVYWQERMEDQPTGPLATYEWIDPEEDVEPIQVEHGGLRTVRR